MKALIDKLGSRKLAVTAIAGAGVAVAGPELLTWPAAICWRKDMRTEKRQEVE